MAFKPGVAEQIRKQAMRSGQPIPDRILFAPQLPTTLEFFYNAFWQLTNCRSVGMGLGPIPITAIITYGQFYDCNKDMIDDLILFVSQMDIVYLKKQNKKESQGK